MGARRSELMGAGRAGRLGSAWAASGGGAMLASLGKAIHTREMVRASGARLKSAASTFERARVLVWAWHSWMMHDLLRPAHTRRAHDK